MKKIIFVILFTLLLIKSYSGNPVYVTFNKSFLVKSQDEINHHDLQVWKFDKESMTLTFFDTMKSFPITTWEDKEENRKHIIADLDGYSATIVISSPWTITVYFWQRNDDETYSYMYGQTFYLEELPDWYFVSGDGKDSYWNW